MIAYGNVRFGNAAIPWRRLEWWGAGIALYLQTGAIADLPLKVVLPPAFLITVALVLNNLRQIGVALRRTPLVVFMILLPFLSVIWSMSGSLSLKRAVALLLSMALAYVIAIRFTPRQFLALTAAVLAPALAASLLVMVLSPSMAHMPDGTVKGIFGHKNLLGWHAGAGVLVGVLIAIDGGVPRRYGVALAGLGFLCLMASGSATGLLSLGAALIVSFAFRFLRVLDRPGRLMMILLTVQLVAAIYVISASLIAPALESMGKDTSLTGRIPIWQQVDGYIAQRPLLGYGYETFWSDGSGYGWAVRQAVNWDAPNAHNGYRDILLAFGIVGFVPSMVVSLRAMARGTKLYRLAPDTSWLWPNAILTMFLIMNATESIFYVPRSFLFILFMAAVIMITLREPDFHRPRDRYVAGVPQ